ncbi:histidine kinase [Nonomuraea rhodomycinica]|uniref:Two-component sensor histidine kinase n=1 Tax=Nonomuraea rhodomycinica TaxID=1712872 RepID=A0A7Y6IKQ9_9ACTN|nr:histidine kinase [Nonomuraea rhodomycinica]NUW39831.1 two-component sensor histidine kinase [Nonomuraea rhodomycinica]
MTAGDSSDSRAGARWPGVLSAGLFGLAVVEVAVSVLGGAVAGMTWTEAWDRFVVTNAAMGLSFPVGGVLVAWHRPRNPVGWLLLAAGIGHATTAALVPLAEAGVRDGWPIGLNRTLVTVAAWAWPWSIGLCLPLVLQLFPDGRPVFRRLMWATVVTSPLFVLEMGAGPDPVVAGLSGHLVIHADLDALWTAVEVRGVVAVAIGLVALVVRYRRGDERRRRQLLWLMQAVLLVLIVMVPWGVLRNAPVHVLLAIPLVPAAMTVAILRHQLLDIRLVVSRTVLYALLTAVVVASYVALVALFDGVMRREVGLGGSAAATVLIAVGFNPVRVRLQRVVDRILYGDRADPVRAVSRVGARLDTGLPGVLEAVREALRLPFAALRVDNTEVASCGAAPELLHTIPLTYGGVRVGELVIGLRAGEKRLGGPDRAVLELLAAPLSVAVHAVALSEQLQRSREALVAAREEERRRLRRDLHDGLGPVLTGVTFKADAAGNLLATDPGSARALLAELRAEATQAIDDIRRLVHDLRPPALDDLGLAGAIRQRAAQLERPGMTVRVEAADLPALPAAVEAAAYRIAVEALTNAVRHSGAGRVRVRIRADGHPAAAGPATRCLHVEVADDGTGSGGAWRPGVGMRSMRERAAELGGTCTAGAAPTGGGRVAATLPLGAP